MKTFRKVYVYNSEKPVYTSANARTYQCLNNETGDKRLIIIHHLKELPQVDSHSNVLQPVEVPTKEEPFSVYPITHCVSEVGKIEEHDAMYFLKCLLESPQKQPMYSLVSPQGICTSNIEGLLPEPSPKLFELMIGLLDIPENLATVPRTMISKECAAIMRGLREGDSVLSSVNILGGWKDKKEVVKDTEFWVFKGRRKEQGILSEEYALAWGLAPKMGLVRLKVLDMSKGDVDRTNLQDYMRRANFMIEESASKLNLLKVFKCQQEPKQIKLFVQNTNQGTLSDYLSKRKDLNLPVREDEFFPILQKFVDTMKEIVPILGAHTTLHIKYVYMDYNTMLLGEPMLISDRSEKKLRELRNSMDYFAPELKENIIIRENVMKLDQEKIDIWSFGFLLHKIFMFEVPVFDPARKPIIKDNKMSSGLISLIQSCLRLNPAERPKWADIDFSKIKREKKDEVMVHEVEPEQPERELVRLGSRKESVRAKSPEKTIKAELQKPSSPGRDDSPRKATEASLKPESPKRASSPKKLTEAALNDMVLSKEVSEARLKEQDELLDIEEEMMIAKPATPAVAIPQQLSHRLKQIKLIFKILVILVLYLALFFGQFISGTVGLFTSRGFLKSATLYSLDSSGSIQSSVTVLTSNPQYFMLNDISFGDVSDTYHCINDQFDPIYNPSFSLNTYIQSNAFIGVMVAGWIYILLVIVVKSIMIWNAGLSNKTEKDGWRYWFIYGFHELALATLLYAHFYLFEFFYFCKVSPCFSILPFNGVEPYFDSILYLFLTNLQGYFAKVFTTMCLFGLLLYGSLLYHSFAVRKDVKNFFGVFSIVFRVVPWVAFLVICRIGVFKLYAPSGINDPLSMLPSILNNSFYGFLGIIPELFIVICVLAELLLQLVFYYCEKNAAKSDLLNRLFNTDKKKSSVGNSNPFESRELPQDSMVMSRNQLDLSELH